MPAAVHRLGLLESVRVLRGLTRADRVDHLVALARDRPGGALLRTPFGRMLITATPSAVKHVLVRHADRYVKGLGQAQAREIIGEGLLTAEGEHWRRQRRDVTPYLAARAVHAHQGRFLALARAGAATVEERGWDAVDPAVLLAEYTLGCLGVTFGFPAPAAEHIHEAFDTIQDEALFRSVSQGLVPLRARPRARARVHAALRLLARETSGSLPGHRDDAWATPEGMTSLFLAGYETTASTLAWAITYLAQHPAVQEQIAAEASVLDALGPDDVTPRHLAALRWSSATLDETLRLRPPVWLVSRRATVADTVDGVALSPGDEVLILPAAAQSADPDFRPERFLSGARESSLDFGAGPRACPGGALAQAEAVLWLSTACGRLALRPRGRRTVTALARMSQAPAPDLRDVVDVVPRSGTSPSRPAALPTVPERNPL
ncbi:cytochrome P450 [Myceligenerans xiligouense]|uniref:Cytochrome P450 n=1 Tax=Myceligenerans xiligouense TaxID=253184 RepID=A0A3N4ZFX7_9MICO|nr:cytochrome P450 [Myceligenerans xiligouense]RPF19725.1 cytochrome P450 [Myceligenerans xiligouense]